MGTTWLADMVLREKRWKRRHIFWYLGSSVLLRFFPPARSSRWGRTYLAQAFWMQACFWYSDPQARSYHMPYTLVPLIAYNVGTSPSGFQWIPACYWQTCVLGLSTPRSFERLGFYPWYQAANCFLGGFKVGEKWDQPGTLSRGVILLESCYGQHIDQIIQFDITEYVEMGFDHLVTSFCLTIGLSIETSLTLLTVFQVASELLASCWT